MRNLERVDPPPPRLLLWREDDRYFAERLRPAAADWTFARFRPPYQGRRRADLLIDATRPWPCADASLEAVYVRRIVEMLRPAEADALIAEASRVLRPGGVLRVSVPDFEDAAREYLRVMAALRESPDETLEARRRELSLELADQFLRWRSGGRLRPYIADGRFPAERLATRYGDVFRLPLPPAPTPAPWRRWARRAREFARLWRGERNYPDILWQREKTLWIYDRFSLPLMAERRGFRDARAVSADVSAIAGWDRWRLDLSAHGDRPHEPSLFVEAVRDGPGSREGS